MLHSILLGRNNTENHIEMSEKLIQMLNTEDFFQNVWPDNINLFKFKENFTEIFLRLLIIDSLLTHYH